MTKSKDTKRALLGSLLSLMVCLAMLVGSTFAWFTDSVVSGTNKIVAGNLDVELLHSNGNVKEETKVLPDSKLFVDVNGQDIKWEPGVMVYENFTVKNVGSLALKYKLKVNVGEYNTVTVNGKEKSLKDVLKVAILDQHLTHTTRDAVIKDTSIKFEKKVSDFEKVDTLNAGAADKKYAMIIYWQPTENDNDYNINNTKTVNPVATKASDTDNALFIELGVKLEATQHTVENDSFDETYDKNAWDDMILTDNHNGTYSDDTGQMYIKPDGNLVPVTPSAESPAIVVSEDNQAYVVAKNTATPVTKSTTQDGLYTDDKTGDKYVINDDALAEATKTSGNVAILNDVQEVNNSNDFMQSPYIDIPEKSTTNIELNEKVLDIDSKTGKNGIKVEKDAEASFSNGTITMNVGWGSSYGVINAEKSTITLDNMTVINEGADGSCVSAGADGGLVTIKNSTVRGGGSYSGTVFCSSGSTVIVENSTIIGSVVLQTNANMTIKSGDFTQAIFRIGGNGGTRIIHAGTFKVNPRNIGGFTLAEGSTVTSSNGIWTVTAAN